MNNLAINTERSDDELDESVDLLTEEAEDQSIIALNTFIDDFGDDLLNAVKRQNPPVYDEVPCSHRALIMDNMPRKPFEAQQRVVQAITRLLVDQNEKAAIINAEMGTGKVRRIGA